MNRVKLSRVSPRIGGRVGSGKSTPGWKAVMVVIVDYAGDSTKDAWNKKIIERQYAVVLSRLKRSDNRALIIGGREIGARVDQMKRFTCVSSLAAQGQKLEDWPP